MSEITKETRLSSYITRPANKRQMMILQALGDREMTARQIAVELGFTDLNAVKPRLTELKKAGKIETTKKAYDMTTGKWVAMWRRCESA